MITTLQLADRPPSLDRGIGIIPLLANPATIKAFVTLGVAVGKLLANAFKGCGESCTLSSQIANQVEQHLQQNVAMYLALPTPRFRSQQLAGLQVFDQTWNTLVERCGSVGGPGGKRCVEDRTPDACHWTTSPGGWNGDTYTAPGAAGSGSACWNWFVGYRDPIASDPNVIDDPPPAATGIDAVSQVFNGPDSMLWISAGLVGLLVLGFVVAKD